MGRENIQGLTVNFTTAIAAGASGVTQYKVVPQTYTFVIEDLRGSVRLASLTGAAIAGTELLLDPSPTIGSNTFPSANLVTGNILTNDYQWFDEDIPVSLFLSRGNLPAPFTTRPTVRPGDRIGVRINNGTNAAVPATLFCSFLFMGRAVYN